MEYNTTREHLVIKEYGRGIQKLVQELVDIKDKKERQQKAEAIVGVMSILNPESKGVEDYEHKLWDHLFMISEYKLDVESPYPMPTQEEKMAKPEPMAYPQKKIKWNHLGKNFEQLFEKALAEKDPEKKQGYVQSLGQFMKVAYSTWHKENVQEETVRNELKTLSEGKLELKEGAYKEFVDDGNSPLIRAKNHANLVNFTKRKKRSGGHRSNNRNSNNRNSNNRNRKYSKRR